MPGREAMRLAFVFGKEGGGFRGEERGVGVFMCMSLDCFCRARKKARPNGGSAEGIDL